MEIFSSVFLVVIMVVTIIFAVVGVQLFLVLIELKKTIHKFNAVLDNAESKINSVVSPLQNLGGMAGGLQTGFKVFESFVGWLHRNKSVNAKK